MQPIILLQANLTNKYFCEQLNRSTNGPTLLGGTTRECAYYLEHVGFWLGATALEFYTGSLALANKKADPPYASMFTPFESRLRMIVISLWNHLRKRFRR